MSRGRKSKQPIPTVLTRYMVGKVVYYAIVGILLMIAVWALRGRLNLAALSSSDNATNPIGVEVSGNPTDTDILSLQAVESGQLNQPALVWFHADW